MLEADLAEPVMKWLDSRGFVPYGEVPWFGRGIDVVGISAAGVSEAVELKRSLTKSVIYQANLTLSAADRAWAAVGTMPRSLESRVAAGWLKNIGVLRVVEGRVEVLREAPESLGRGGRWTETLTKSCANMQPWGRAGIPTMRGVGPAQSVYNKVQEYLIENPGARWADIFKAVPNHYVHARSMQGAMRVVLEGRRRRAEQIESRRS